MTFINNCTVCAAPAPAPPPRSAAFFTDESSVKIVREERCAILVHERDLACCWAEDGSNFERIKIVGARQLKHDILENDQKMGGKIATDPSNKRNPMMHYMHRKEEGRGIIFSRSLGGRLRLASRVFMLGARGAGRVERRRTKWGE